MPRILGLTGNIACGKTTVGRMLLELGAERYIDADALVHSLYDAGQSTARQVAEAFGTTVVAANGSIDRGALGHVVFQDSAAMQRLERIVHPAVRQALFAQLATVSSTGVAIVDAVKLLEGGSSALCQSVWLILCSEERQLTRLMSQRSLSAEEARLRIRAQPPLAPKKAWVDEIISTDGSLQETHDQVVRAFERFCTTFPA